MLLNICFSIDIAISTFSYMYFSYTQLNKVIPYILISKRYQKY